MRLSAFRRSVDNMIIWADADGDVVYLPGNVAQATVTGWEAEVLYRPSASIAIPVGYQRLSTQDGETGDSLPGAVHSLWRAASRGPASRSPGRSSTPPPTASDFRQPEGVRELHRVNAALAWRDKIGSVPVQVSLRAENLQDREYETVEGYPMRGRSWFAEVKVGL